MFKLRASGSDYFALSGVSKLPGRVLKSQTRLINNDILTACSLIGGTLPQMTRGNIVRVFFSEISKNTKLVCKHEATTL